MTLISIDTETYSAVDLKRAGLYRYMEDPTTDVHCACWAIDDGPVQAWHPGMPPPTFPECALFIAYNAAFDAEVWRQILTPRYGWDWPGYDRFRCSMAQAAYGNLPGSLGQVAKALGTREKDAIGSKLMLQLCKPAREIQSDTDPRRLHTAGNLTRLTDYCKDDVRAERALHPLLPPLPAEEVRVRVMDWSMNRRGIAVDLPLVHRLSALFDVYCELQRTELARLTHGDVESETKLAQIAAWCSVNGYTIGTGKGTMDAEAIDRYLEDPLIPDDVHAVLSIRRNLGKSSLAKLDRLVDATCADGRVRGLLLYYGAHQTGRWAGKIVQTQNLPRGILQGAQEYDSALAIVNGGNAHQAYDMLEAFYGADQTAAVLSSLIRPCFIAAPGTKLHICDYSAIEGRILAWLAGEEHILDAYRAGKRMYCVAAAGIFNEPYEVINEKRKTDPRYNHMDKVGKVVELACIAEGQLVLTQRGLVPIQDVHPLDRVWDGVDFVEHDGVVFRGIKECLTHDGLTATADHQVWIHGQPGPVAFGFAAASGAHLVQTGLGRVPIRLGDDHPARGSVPATRPPRRAYRSPVHRLWLGGVDQPGQPHERQVEGVPDVQPAAQDSAVVGQAVDHSQGPMHRSIAQAVRGLWRAWDHIRLCFRAGRWFMDHQQHRVAQGPFDRSNRQFQGLWTGKSPVGHKPGAKPQHASSQAASVPQRVGGSPIAAGPGHDQAPAAGGADSGADHREGQDLRSGASQGLADHAGTTRSLRVYDILNCGPRHRFTVSGRLAHNCGYQGSVGAFAKMGANYGLYLPEDEVRIIVKGWRDSRPKTVQFWYDCEKAALAALRQPGRGFRVGRVVFGFDGKHLRCQLPSKRVLWYRDAHIRLKQVPWTSEPKPSLAFYGEIEGGRYGLTDTYGGCLVENITQAVARDILAEASLRVDAAGIPIVTLVHDEIVAESASDDPHLLKRFMDVLPEWADGLPMKCEGFISPYYRKG